MARVACVIACSCSESGSDLSAPLPARVEDAGPRVQGTLGKDRAATLRALSLRPRDIARLLGPHELSGRLTIRSRVPGSADREVAHRLRLRLDQQGSFALVKNTHPQHGSEVVWQGGWLYARQRYSRFVRRRPRPSEPLALLDRLAGYLPTYVGLLGPALAFELRGQGTYKGRPVQRVGLRLGTSLRAPRHGSPRPASSRWRGTVRATLLDGTALLDRKTGVPLSVDLRARWSFSPPVAGPLPRSGIPDRLASGGTGTMELTLSQSIQKVGAVTKIGPPPEDQTIADPRRRRLELERQMFDGELPIAEDWRKIP